MSEAKRIDGKANAAALRDRLTAAVRDLKDAHRLDPGLAVVLVGEDPASQIYVRNKVAQCADVGMESLEFRRTVDISQAELLTLIEGLNDRDDVHGILVQLPLPAHIDPMAVLAAIDPAKDVDGFHVINAGRLSTGQDCLVPCTPAGCMILIKGVLGDDLSGLDAVVVGRSNIVGKPMAQLLLRENCTVTVAHSRTRDLPEACRRADILVAAVGRPRMIGAGFIKPGATVIDVGMNRIDAPDKGPGKTRLVGDVDFPAALRVAGAITPVPGGVGPMTIASLLRNTLLAACRQKGVEAPEI